MESQLYNLILTRSSHSISRQAALEVKRALEVGEPTVEIELTLFRSEIRRTIINTAHIIAIAEDMSESLRRGPEKVRRIRAGSRGV